MSRITPSVTSAVTFRRAMRITRMSPKMPAVVTPMASATAMQPSGMASIAARVEIGLPQLSGVARSSRTGTKRSVNAGPTSRGPPGDQRHRALDPAVPDALLQQHGGDGGGGDVAQDVEGGAHGSTPRQAGGQAEPLVAAAQIMHERDRQQHHPGLADDLPGQEIERAEGEPQEDDGIDHEPDQARSDHGGDQPAAGERRIDREIGQSPKRGTPRPRRAPATAARRATKGSRRRPRPRPNTPTPSRRCTRSRSTSAMPIISTPDGAIRLDAADFRQHRDQAWAVRRADGADIAGSSSWPAGMVRPNATRNTMPSITLARCRMFMSSYLPSRNGQSLRPAAGMPGTRRSHSPNRGDDSGHRDSSYGFPRSPNQATRVPPMSSANAKVAGLVDPHQRRVDGRSAGPCRATARVCIALMVSSRQSG